MSNGKHGQVYCITVYFTNEEQTILDKYEEVKHIIQAKGNTVAAAKCRKDSWKKIVDCVNA